MRRFIRNLPGPISYCNCIESCSEIQVDHVVPRAFLKQNITEIKTLKHALKDSHNMYACCENINQKKSDKLLGIDFTAGQNNPYLSRAALYMNKTYDLNVDEEILHKWKVMNMEIEPWEFETKRSNMIKERQGNGNEFIEYYPRKVTLLNGANFCN